LPFKPKYAWGPDERSLKAAELKRQELKPKIERIYMARSPSRDPRLNKGYESKRDAHVKRQDELK
jgi:hypothetical protein